MSYHLFIDDERNPPRNDGNNWIVARDWEDVKLTLRREGFPKFISFDHDLGENTIDGYEIVKKLVEFDMGCGDLKFPANFAFYVHSQNPVGKRNIEHYLSQYLKVRNQ